MSPPAGGPASAAWNEGAYGAETTEHTYRTVLSRAATALARGESVVVDASFHDADRRASVRRLGSDANAGVVELRCSAPQDLAVKRVLARQRSDPSDATPAIAERMAAAFAPWPEATTIDTSRPLDESVRTALEALMGSS